VVQPLPVDQTRRYLELCKRGRDEFLADAADAVLVRHRGDLAKLTERALTSGLQTATFEPEETTLVTSQGHLSKYSSPSEIDIFPLVKKPGAPFPDMITIGRTGNNDVVMNDITVSRFHAYFRQADGRWLVSDAGSRNGTRLDHVRLEPRKEREVVPGSVVSIGDIECKFLPAGELFDLLSRLPR
jgi:hypothetical protein